MGKKHPLDIFRLSNSGFDTASRERRTMIGRVVASAPRMAAGAATAPAPSAPAAAAPPPLHKAPALPPAVAAARAQAAVAAPPPLPTRRPLQPPEIAVAPPSAAQVAAPAAPVAPRRAPETPRAAEKPVEKPRARREPAAEPAKTSRLAPTSINRTLLYVAGVLVGGLTVWTVGASLGGPSLKSQAPVVAAAAMQVQAASYPGTPAGMSAAFNARDLLRQQGFAGVEVQAWPGATPDTYSRFDLVVGKGGSEAALGDVAKKLRNIKNWPGAVKAPFKDAAVKPAGP